MVKIVEKRQLTPITKLYRVEAPLIARAARAGQFVIVRVREGGERIPLTITDYDRDSGLLTIATPGPPRGGRRNPRHGRPAG